MLVSGGADSACAAAGLARALGPRTSTRCTSTTGFGAAADRDERVARDLCCAAADRPPRRAPGLARRETSRPPRADFRYAAAERLRARAGGDWIATGHTPHRPRRDGALPPRRLAGSAEPPLACAPQSGRVVRPLLDLERAELRAPRHRGGPALRRRRDQRSTRRSRATGSAPRSCRCSRDLSAAAERNIAETQAELAEEADLLERVVLEALEAAGAGAGAVAIRADALAGSEPALRRLALRAARGARRRAARCRSDGGGRPRSCAWPTMPEGGEVDLGDGVRAICEQGLIRFETSIGGRRRPGAGRASSPRELPVRALGGPRRAPRRRRSSPRGPTSRRSTPRRSATSWSGPHLARGRPDAAARHGRHARRLQDLFTDRGVPRSLRHAPAGGDRRRAASSGSPAWPCREDFRLVRGREVAVHSSRYSTARPMAAHVDYAPVDDPAIGETLVTAGRAPAPGRGARRRDQPRLRGPRPGDDRHAEGRGAVPRPT